MALNVVSSDRLSTNVKTSNLATGLSTKVGTNKNIIINGSFNVAQRGTSSTSSLYQTVDRFKYGWSGTDEAPTQAQHALTSSDTGPWAKGFRYSYHVTNGNQTSGAGAADIIYLYHFIEAQDIASSGWDYTNASSKLTLSFWIKSSVAQNFYGFVKTMDGTAQLLTFETTALTADTWKKVTVSIPGHANLQFDNNAEAGLQIAWMPFFGTDYTTSGKTLNAWAAYSGSDRSPDNTSTWYTTNDSTFEITGVQLEVGDTATEFEHRSYGDELARCQRYFFNKKGDNTDFGGMVGYVNSADTVRFNVNFPVPMRATPSFTGSATACYFDSSDDSAEFNISTLAIVRANQTTSPSSLTLATSSTSSVTAGQGGQFEFRADSGYLNFSAEL